MDFYTKSISEIEKELKTSKDGLKDDEAKERLNLYGKNVLPQKKQKSKFVRFLSQFADIMIIILFVAAAISITVAIVEKTYSEMVDGFIILGIVFLNATLGFIQELKAEKEMKALLLVSEPETKVKRNGEIVKIHASEITIGDVIVLEAGDIVPADLRLIDSANLKCDESSLTGESLAVEKDYKSVCNNNTALADRKNMVYKGSVVSLGRGEGIVVSVGKDTELGKIATMLNETEKDITPLQKNIKFVGKIITIVVLIIAALTFGIELISRPDGNVINAFLTAVAISVAAIPESMPAVITIIMSMGVSVLSKKKAIVKRLHAVETLGSTQIICSDKTGTLTQNVMTVRQVYFDNKLVEAKKYNGFTFENLIKTMVLCNDSKKSKQSYSGDPTETALAYFGDKCDFDKQSTDSLNIRIGEIPFDSNRKLMSTINKSKNGCMQYTKGGPDLILKNCSHIMIDGEICDLTEQHKQQIIEANKKMASGALRVLGLAIKNVEDKDVYLTEEISEQNLVFVGLVGMMDPPRKEALLAVKKCKKAHMIPIMITGDHSDTAFAVAKEIGICDDISQVITGVMLDAMSDEEYKQKIDSIKVYARVSPENKVRIVKTFKELGRIVAMTGDGVNDAPSLKTADIGVGMGITGTDVTKEVADMIVTDDNFATIVVAVEEGRRIYSNIIKTIAYLFAANIAEILGLFLATLFFPTTTFLTPVQILFVNLITDSMPAIALGFEKAEENLMEKPPRKSNSTVFSDGIGTKIIIMGLVQTIAILGSFCFGYYLYSEEVATTMAFVSLNLVQLSYLLSIRVNACALKSNFVKNKWIVYSLAIGLGLVLIFTLTPLRTILGLSALSIIQWLIAIGSGLFVFIVNELLKIKKR